MKSKQEKSSAQQKCGLCKSTKKPLTKTPCCDNWICDDEDSYVVFSYAKNSCYRNHDRYTLCAFHFREEHEGQWQDCKKCKDSVDLPYYNDMGTNDYNFEKLKHIEKIEIECVNCGFTADSIDAFCCQTSRGYFCTKKKCERAAFMKNNMTIEEILHCFNLPNGCFPTEALNSALAQQEAITPRLISILEDVISNYENMDLSRMDYIFALFILSKFQEKKALPYILKIAELPGEWPEDLLGDCITEGLSRFIVSTFDDDLSPIKKIIENPTANDWSRCAGLNSFLGLIALQKLQRIEVIEYLRGLFHSNLSDDEFFVSSLVNIAADLYPEELLEEINRAFDADKVDLFMIDKKWITNILTQDKEEFISKNIYNDNFHLPIDDVEKDMCWMSAFSPETTLDYNQDNHWSDDDNSDDNDIYDYGETEVAPTYVRETPKVGRNDPCVCGSGKKFKKCCI